MPAFRLDRPKRTCSLVLLMAGTPPRHGCSSGGNRFAASEARVRRARPCRPHGPPHGLCFADELPAELAPRSVALAEQVGEPALSAVGCWWVRLRPSADAACPFGRGCCCPAHVVLGPVRDSAACSIGCRLSSGYVAGLHVGGRQRLSVCPVRSHGAPERLFSCHGPAVRLDLRPSGHPVALRLSLSGRWFAWFLRCACRWSVLPPARQAVLPVLALVVCVDRRRCDALGLLSAEPLTVVLCPAP